MPMRRRPRDVERPVLDIDRAGREDNQRQACRKGDADPADHEDGSSGTSGLNGATPVFRPWRNAAYGWAFAGTISINSIEVAVTARGAPQLSILDRADTRAARLM